MFFGVFGMDSSVAQIYQLFDELKANPEYKEQIHEQLKKVVRTYSSTIFTDFENHFNNLKKAMNEADISPELKAKFSSSIDGLIREYHAVDSKIKELIEQHNAEDGKTLESFNKKKELKAELDKYAMSFLCDEKLNSSFLTEQEREIFLGVYRDFNKRTQVSQIPKMVNRTPDFDINDDACIDRIINMYSRSYKQFEKFDACTVEWDLAFQQALTSGQQIDLSEASMSYNYLVGKGKKIRALSMVYPNACPDFDENITKEQFLEIFEGYLHQLFRTCPDVDYLDFFNELAYDEGMHAMFGEPKRQPNEYGIILETGKSHPNPSIFEKLFGQRYYIPLLESARKVMAEEERIQGRKIETKLMYNEFGHESGEKCKNILRILKDIRTYEREHNIHLLDGVGVQCRLTSDIPTIDESKKPEAIFSPNPSLENIETFIEMARGLDTTIPLEVQITEMDCIKVDKNQHGKLTPDENQERVYREIFDIGTRQMDKGNITGFTLGDFNDTTSFSAQTARSKVESNDPSPTLYQEDGKVKPFAEGLVADMRSNVTHHNEQVHQANTGLQVPSDN